MEHCMGDGCDAGPQAAAASEGDPAEPDDGGPPNVIITVSLDELDGMTGDMLV